MSATQNGRLRFLKVDNPSYDECLLELLIEQHYCGKTLYNVFRREVFRTVKRKLNEYFGVKMEENEIKTRYNAMKEDYGALKTILGHPGFKFDGNTRTIVADDKDWEKFIAVRPAFRRYQSRVFLPYFGLSIVFEEYSTEDSPKVVSDQERVQSSDPKKQPAQFVNDVVDVDSTFHLNKAQPGKRKSTPLANLGHKNDVLEAEDSIENAFCETPASRLVPSNVNNLLSEKRKSTSVATSGCDKRAQVKTKDCAETALYDNVTDARYQRCLEELQEIEELDDLEFAKAVNALKDDKNAIAFLTIKGRRRLIWLGSIVRG